MSGLGSILVERGLLSTEQLAEASDEHQRTHRPLGRILIERGLISESDLVAALASQIGMDYVELTEERIDPQAASMVGLDTCRRHQLLPIRIEQNKLVVAMADPANIVARDDVRTITKMDVKPVVATRKDVFTAIDRVASMSFSVASIGEEDELDEAKSVDLASLRAVTEEAPIVKFVNLLISQAVADGASDIHIEPTERELRVRYRIDGVLHEVMRSPRSIQSGVISRLKVMAEVDISERRVPQDGRISVKVHGREIDLRFSTLPTVYGEKVVLRILDKTSVLLRLDDLGFREHNLVRYEAAYRKPHGAILVTGPTGSGKSTTLYATLNVINHVGINIITTEDPVEYRLPGISQVQVRPKVGLTFANALRSILRQDPDVVLVGEMRDGETAQMGVEAALTGHLVLTTLHTNDAPSAITRLTEMGVAPFLVGSAVHCVLAQRLARRVCKRCTDKVRPDAAALHEAGFPPDVVDARPEIPKANGCSACSHTGYRGRMAIHEVMLMTEEIERLTVARASAEELQHVAIEQGMETLRQDGLAKVLRGDTTIEEIARVAV